MKGYACAVVGIVREVESWNAHLDLGWNSTHLRVSSLKRKKEKKELNLLCAEIQSESQLELVSGLTLWHSFSLWAVVLFF